MVLMRIAPASHDEPWSSTSFGMEFFRLPMPLRLQVCPLFPPAVRWTGNSFRFFLIQRARVAVKIVTCSGDRIRLRAALRLSSHVAPIDLTFLTNGGLIMKAIDRGAHHVFAIRKCCLTCWSYTVDYHSCRIREFGPRIPMQPAGSSLGSQAVDSVPGFVASRK